MQMPMKATTLGCLSAAISDASCSGQRQWPHCTLQGDQERSD
jgi:hypothetical protein